MTLFETKPYDPVAARRKRNRIIAIIVIVAVCAILAWNFRHYPEEHQVDKFFAALQQKNYEQAYQLFGEAYQHAVG